MKDKRVTNEDLKAFAHSEALRSILEIKNLADLDLREHRDSLIATIQPKMKMLRESNYNSNFEAVQDLPQDLTAEEIIDRFQIAEIEEGYLIRADFDKDRMIEMKKDWFVKTVTDRGHNKSKRDALWRDLISYDHQRVSLEEVDVQSEDDGLIAESSLIPSIDEIIEILSVNEMSANQLKQIFYSAIKGQRLEDRTIILSGHKTCKSLFIQVLKSLTKNRLMQISTKKLAKDSFEKTISQAIYLTNAATENDIEKIFDQLPAPLIIIEDSNFIGDPIRSVKVQLDRAAIDQIETKINILKAIDFVDAAIKDLSECKDLQTNRYFRQSYEEDDRLQEFLRYLNDIALIGNESLPSAMLYALYLDYCRYRKIKSEFNTQSQFSKAMSESLLRYRYVLSEKTERIKSIIKSARLDSRLVEDMLETNLHFKDLYESNRASKVFNLRFDLVESSIQNIESAVYEVTDLRVRRLTDKYSQILHNQDQTLRIATDDYSKNIEDLIGEQVKESTFKTIELTKYLAQRLVTDLSSQVEDRFKQIDSVVSLELTANLRITLINELYAAADKLDSIDRAFRYEELDTQMINLLSERKDTKAKKILKTFSSSVDRKKKQKSREIVIAEICKNVRLI